jgi:hypothetical protein
MTEQDRERLDGLLAAVESQHEALQDTAVLDAPEDPQSESSRGGLAVKAAQNGHAYPLALGPSR